MRSKEFIPDRGDIVRINFNSQAGHEQSGRRPAVILSPASYNKKVGLVLLCPVTTKVKGFPFEVLIPDGYSVRGVVLADQVKSLDWRVRKAERITKLPDDVINEILGKLGTLLFQSL